MASVLIMHSFLGIYSDMTFLHGALVTPEIAKKKLAVAVTLLIFKLTMNIHLDQNESRQYRHCHERCTSRCNSAVK